MAPCQETALNALLEPKYPVSSPLSLLAYRMFNGLVESLEERTHLTKSTCSTMYPCYGDYWLVGPSLEYDYDYADDDYDVYLFWPSFSQVLVPVDTRYVEGFEPVSPFELHSDEGSDELDELDLGSSQLLNFEPTWSFDSDFVFPDVGLIEEDAYGYSRLFRMGLVSKVNSHHTHSRLHPTLTQAVDWSELYS
ncbi:hypothetical protein BDY19DRAFT_988096 [Irpex rosettiformis]|uniref:Uncharacterized protein n=1 Tax=Irpex rosettiformis TaxID=378272 RepID=A0ACB8UIZ4_9APHY|nr:hypothetical protein BDY19DRAFT_988096 [Irpex rosettiformis]